MNSKASEKESTISRIGQRRQVVIPKSIFNALRLREGDFLEIKIETGRVSMRPKKLVDADDAITPAEAKKLRNALKQMKAGKIKPWIQLKHELGL